MALLIEAGQMTASDYVPTHPDLPLASEGASTEDISTSEFVCRNLPFIHCASFGPPAGD